VEAWLEAPAVELIGEDLGYWPRLRQLLVGAKISGPRVHDARIAALCGLHGVRELWTADRDFSRFPEVVTRNPLRA
jgi:predicted nucleic acid-binding protein